MTEGKRKRDIGLRRKSSAKKGAQKNEPYPQATSIVAKLSRFVKCLQQIFAKKSPLRRSKRGSDNILQDYYKFVTTL